MIKGIVFKYGSNVDTDVIIPARYLNTTDPAELASHCMEDIDSEFVKRVKPCDIIVADDNFGCGSSREHAPIAIKASGIQCVIARSFARIFYRNAFNIGLCLIETDTDKINEKDMLDLDLDKGVVSNVSKGINLESKPLPSFMQELLREGGIINYFKKYKELKI